ncbi:UPF0182 family protein [Aeromicrobium camelliae]|uniref:UPF0182 protein EHW97_10490 n=1 Tax=Aeromicrobium camelliae TaxID=1538144 RepID=A0A3N6Z8N2_9ACTN|nr:UPF0182 family protein [Aeromicrobium camelliae]RQN03307.1 UPF0182 family protein [Aeromicrobium camelliae]
MSDIFGAPRPQPAAPPPDRRRRVLVPTLITLAALVVLGSVFTNVWTNRLWFRSVDYSDVFTTVIWTRVGLFVSFAIVFALFVALNLFLAYRTRAEPHLLRRDDPAARYRFALTPVRKAAFIIISVILGIFAGVVGQSRWETFQQWWHGTEFGVEDPHFGRDNGFFVFDLPWLTFIASFAFTMVIITIVVTAFVHYVYGGIRFAGRGLSFTRGAQIQIAVLAGIAVLIKAFQYWLDRFTLLLGTGGVVDGATYTDANARIPSKNIMIAVAIICALLFFSTIIARSWTLPAIGLGGLILSSVLIGGLWPAFMQQFQVSPSEADREEPYIARNIEATRAAYGVSEVETRSYSAATELSPEELNASAESRVSSRLIDPTLVSPAFQQLQQVRGYYTVNKTLDVDRYRFDGEDQPRDVIIAAREVDLDGLQSSQRTWSNDHTVYTHGYGVIAAYGNERGPQGEPVWAARDIPPTGEFEFEVPPRIYFGEKSPEYSIVGRPEGAEPIEVDIPRGSGGSDDDNPENATANTYDGEGGVPVGNLFNKVLYALKFAEPNIVLSDRVNEESKILYDRHPRERVQKVAPWLTVDGDIYPAVVDGRVVWIADGYTTSNSYPYSQHRSLREATSDTLTQTAAQMALPTDQVNYIRNSVKAVVDAYDGTVDLYQWDEEDPVLKTWMKVFPDSVKPKSEISEGLLEHLRYPVDLFKVQRDILTRYHVTDAQTFYEDGERWRVPEDPSGNQGALQPPYYLTMSRPDQETPQFSLTSVYLPNNRQNLASFMSVNSEASDPENYGKLQILELPSETRVGGPNQIAAQIQADNQVTQTLLPFEQATNARILRGNLLTLPVGGALLYVQPVYIQRSVEEGSYPVLQYIIASFGEDVGIGNTLDEALRAALGLEEGAAPPPEDEVEAPPEEGDGGEPAEAQTPEQLLQQATELYDQAQQALQEGDLATYQRRINEMADAIEQAEQQLGGGS